MRKLSEYLKIHPTFLPMLFIISLTCIQLSRRMPFNPDDYWWHVKTGEDILDMGILNFIKNGMRDTYSWLSATNNLEWVNHSWLAEVVIFIFYMTFGDLGTILYMGLFIILTLYFAIEIYMLHRNRNIPEAGYLLIAICALFYPLLSLPRPYMISNLFVMMYMYYLESIRLEKNVKKYTVCGIAIVLLWANVHGSSVLIAWCMALFYLCYSPIEAFVQEPRIKFEKQSFLYELKKHVRNFLPLTILTVIVSFVNPYGYKTVVYMFTESEGMQFITEWQPMSWENNKIDIIISGILILIVLISITVKKFNIRHSFIIFIIFIAAFLKNRYFIYLLLMSIPCLMYMFESIKIKHLKEMLAILSVGIILLSGYYFVTANNVLEKPIADDMIAHIKEVEPERLYNIYDFGGYLIYNGIPVFFDQRSNLYSGILTEGTILANVPGKDVEEYYSCSVTQVLEKYQFDYLLMKKTDSLYEYLSDSPDYVLDYESEDEALFVSVSD